VFSISPVVGTYRHLDETDRVIDDTLKLKSNIRMAWRVADRNAIPFAVLEIQYLTNIPSSAPMYMTKNPKAVCQRNRPGGDRRHQQNGKPCRALGDSSGMFDTA